jgi:hypothetical protein
MVYGENLLELVECKIDLDIVMQELGNVGHHSNTSFIRGNQASQHEDGL